MHLPPTLPIRAFLIPGLSPVFEVAQDKPKIRHFLNFNGVFSCIHFSLQIFIKVAIHGQNLNIVKILYAKGKRHQIYDDFDIFFFGNVQSIISHYV
jgi:hypothetical protein